jgi:hypothetical protein
MTREEFLLFQEKFYLANIEITKLKNADYTGGTDDPFSNFKIVQYIGACSVEQGFVTRMSDKLSRIASFTKNGTLMVKDESVKDTLADLANYCSLFAGYLESQKRGMSND